jgi:molybdopterin biosynthesis enzyme
VLLLPDRAEDALAAWWLLGRPLLRHLAGAAASPPREARLARKVASAIGLAELVPLRFTEPGVVQPLAVGALPLGILATADALLVVPPGAEGYEAGSMIACDAL